MDAAAPGWYFSTVARPAPRSVRRIDFHRTKYGRELLFDAALLSELPTFDFSDRPQVLTFYDVTLVTRGRGLLELDGVAHALRPGRVFFSRPGSLRRFRTPGFDAACFFFTAEFVGEAFADARFLERFRCLRADAGHAALDLSATERRAFRERFSRMQAELRVLGEDASDALRALLYEMLVGLERAYVARHGTRPAARAPRSVERFLALAERDFARHRSVADYASELGLSAGHLGALCRASLGLSAGAWLRGRLALEARRLLAYSGRGAAEIGYALGFEDPSYFARFVRRETGRSPSDLAARGPAEGPSKPGGPGTSRAAGRRATATGRAARKA